MRTIAKAIALVVALVLAFGVIGCARTASAARRTDASIATEATSAINVKTNTATVADTSTVVERGPARLDRKLTIRIDASPGKPGRTITDERTYRRGPSKRTSGTSTKARAVGVAEAAGSSSARGTSSTASKSNTDSRFGFSVWTLALAGVFGVVFLVALALLAKRYVWPWARKLLTGGVL